MPFLSKFGGGLFVFVLFCFVLFLLIKDPIQDHPVHLVIMSFQSPFSATFSQPCVVHVNDIFEEYRPIILQKIPQCVSLTVPHDQIQVMHFWQEYHRSTLLSASYQQEDEAVCPITGDINFGHLVKVAATSFLYYKVTNFLFIISKYLVRRHLDFCSPILASIYSPCLKKLLLQWLSCSDFLILSSVLYL